MARYVLGPDKWVHPDTGTMHEAFEEIELPDDDDPTHQPNVYWEPLDEMAATAIEKEIDKKQATQAAAEERLVILSGGRRDEKTGDLIGAITEEGRKRWAEEQLTKANARKDLAQLKAGLRKYLEKQEGLKAKQLALQKSQNQQRLDSQAAIFQRGPRANDKSVMTPK